jgi:hypothetical protein
VSEACSSEVKDAARRFNVRLEQERSALDSARAAYREFGSMSLEVDVTLKAMAVMFSVERERIAQRFRFVPLPEANTSGGR